ncbi:hypothetical protein ACIBQ1_38110 [Nonomuraea sp. NPDC050153]|uniref:hypothetical protein n=1 Tax=Nonomuraea sp. NPDC050153 TaxID=3364359 RepID=UPI0037A2601B
MVEIPRSRAESAGCELPTDVALLAGPAYCAIHGASEPGPACLLCPECWHAFPTPEALAADHAATVERLNAKLLAAPPVFDGVEPTLFVAETDPEKITACPHDL